MTTNTQPQTQGSGGDELDKLLSIFHGYVCHSLQSWFKGQTEPFPCDCSVKELKVALQARERAARIDELRLLAAEVKLSKPRNKFVYNKYLRIAYFNERMAQLNPQAGEGGEV